MMIVGPLPWGSCGHHKSKNPVNNHLFSTLPGLSCLVRWSSPPACVNPRFRKYRLRLEISGSGPIVSARLGGVQPKPASDGSVRLPADFESGNMAITTREAEPKKP
jgi:hypothetical protein